MIPFPKPFSIREGSLAALSEAQRCPDQTWQAGLVESPMQADTEAGPVRPFVALIVDVRSRYLLTALVAEPGEDPAQALGDGIVDATRRNRVLPGAIQAKPPLARELAILSQALGVPILPATTLPAVVEVKRAMADYFRRNPAG
jgi:hypothetical protein